METILTSLITQLKNPWQYICVGLIWSALLYFNLEKQYLIPFILISLGLAYLLEKIITSLIIPPFLSIKRYFSNKKLLKTLKNCSDDEKDFLYNRVYENGNELQISINSDRYFYQIDEQSSTHNLLFYKGRFDSKFKIMLFLRQLEKKKIIKNFGNQHMIIPERVWDILIKNANEIFKDFNPLPIEPTEDRIKWAKILYSTVSAEHKALLRHIISSPSAEYKNIKILTPELASQAMMLKIYALFKDFQVDSLTNACIATFLPELYNILEIILKEENNAE